MPKPKRRRSNGTAQPGLCSRSLLCTTSSEAKIQELCPAVPSLAVQGKQHDPHVEKEKHILQQPLGFRTCCPGSVWGLVMVILHLITNKRDAVIPVTQANPFLNKISLQSAQSPKTCANLVSFGLKYCCWAACLWCWWGGIYF